MIAASAIFRITCLLVPEESRTHSRDLGTIWPDEDPVNREQIACAAGDGGTTTPEIDFIFDRYHTA
jgi:hypothetical protein